MWKISESMEAKIQLTLCLTTSVTVYSKWIMREVIFFNLRSSKPKVDHNIVRVFDYLDVNGYQFFTAIQYMLQCARFKPQQSIMMRSCCLRFAYQPSRKDGIHSRTKSPDLSLVSLQASLEIERSSITCLIAQVKVKIKLG